MPCNCGDCQENKEINRLFEPKKSKKDKRVEALEQEIDQLRREITDLKRDADVLSIRISLLERKQSSQPIRPSIPPIMDPFPSYPAYPPGTWMSDNTGLNRGPMICGASRSSFLSGGPLMEYVDQTLTEQP